MLGSSGIAVAAMTVVVPATMTMNTGGRGDAPVSAENPHLRSTAGASLG
jgi:hypothetical protein